MGWWLSTRPLISRSLDLHINWQLDLLTDLMATDREIQGERERERQRERETKRERERGENIYIYVYIYIYMCTCICTSYACILIYICITCIFTSHWWGASPDGRHVPPTWPTWNGNRRRRTSPTRTSWWGTPPMFWKPNLIYGYVNISTSGL